MRLGPILLVLATGILSCHFPIAAASQDSGWSTYSNARFGFVVCSPRAFDGQGEAPNGDGQRFRTHDGAELGVYGSNTEGVGSELLGKAAIEDVAGQDARTLYRARRRDWSVASGVGPKGEFYIKRVVRQDQVISFELLYPAALHARYAPLLAAMLRCFAVGRAPAF